MIEEPQIAETEDQPTAVLRLTIPREQIREVMEPGLREVVDAVAAQGAAAAGPWFAHHLRMDPAIFDFEICVPVVSPISAAGRVQPGLLPGVRVVRTVYHGPYEGLPEAWGEFDAWIAARGLATGTDLWEVYTAGPESNRDPVAWRTELNRPLIG